MTVSVDLLNGKNGKVPADYAPLHSPERLDRLNEQTINSVAAIGKECARQIEADRQRANEMHARLDKYLVELIIATTKYTEFAQEQISAFTAAVTSAEDTVKAAIEKIKVEMTK